MSTLTFAEKLSTAAILISVASFFIAARSAFLDRTRLKVSSVFHEADEWGPAQVVVTVINKGRRPAILRLFGGTDANGIGSGEFFDHEKGGLRLAENERYERTVRRDDTMTLIRTMPTWSSKRFGWRTPWACDTTYRTPRNRSRSCGPIEVPVASGRAQRPHWHSAVSCEGQDWPMKIRHSPFTWPEPPLGAQIRCHRRLLSSHILVL